jgi:hypothetical protein
MYTISIINETYRVAPDGTEWRPGSDPEILYERVPLLMDALTLVSDHAHRIRRAMYVVHVTACRSA